MLLVWLFFCGFFPPISALYLKKRFVPSLLSHFKSVGNCNTFHPSQAGRAYGEDFPAYSSGTSPCFIVSYLPWAACCLALVHPARISGTGCSVTTSRMSQGGVAVMGSQIFVETERVHFSLHAPSLCSSSQTWHGEECCFQMLRRKGGQPASEMSSFWCIYCGLISSPSLSQTINDPALTDLMICGRSTGSHKRYGGFSA